MAAWPLVLEQDRLQLCDVRLREKGLINTLLAASAAGDSGTDRCRGRHAYRRSWASKPMLKRVEGNRRQAATRSRCGGNRVALAVAYKTGKRIGLDTSIRMAMDPIFAPDRERAGNRQPQPFREADEQKGTPALHEQRRLPRTCFKQARRFGSTELELEVPPFPAWRRPYSRYSPNLVANDPVLRLARQGSKRQPLGRVAPLAAQNPFEKTRAGFTASSRACLSRLPFGSKRKGSRSLGLIQSQFSELLSRSVISSSSLRLLRMMISATAPAREKHQFCRRLRFPSWYSHMPVVSVSDG